MSHANSQRLRAWGSRWRAVALAAGIALMGSAVVAKDAPPAAEDPVLEKRMQAITMELRCLVCQNQTIADSHADLAVDLRNQVREMIRQGKSDREIVDYMTARYGDFVLYRPPMKGTTVLLWFGPALLLAGGVAVLWTVLRRRSRLAPEAFEPDTAYEGDTPKERVPDAGAAGAPASPGSETPQPARTATNDKR